MTPAATLHLLHERRQADSTQVPLSEQISSLYLSKVTIRGYRIELINRSGK
jgi:hypothetical protein